MRKNLGAEPVQQGFFIGVTELPHLGHLTDLRPVDFDGPTFPGILGKQRGIHTNLSGEKAYHFGCHLLPRTGKPAFVLQALEEDRKPQACRPRFIADRCSFIGQQRKMLQ